MRASDDLALLAQAADDAGAISLAHFGRAPQVWDKGGDAGPVSQADLDIEAALRARLLAARPDYGWLSEESPDSPDRLARRRVFVVDPLDGTRAFLAGQDGFAHALCVVEDGAPLAAVVTLPRLGHRYLAARGAGATCNGRSIAPSARVQSDGATVLTGRAQLAPALWPGGVPAVDRHARTALAWRLALVAHGQFDAALTLRAAWHWDIAAGALLVAEAGGTVTDGTGAALRFNTADPRAPGVIAAGPALHAALMARRTAR